MKRSSRSPSEQTGGNADGGARSPRLDLSLNGVPRGQRIRTLTDAIRGAVVDGRLRPGETMPSTRGLSADLGVARATVVEAYQQLADEGYLHAQPGGATRVSEHHLPVAVERTPIDVQRSAGHNPGLPDPALFPRADWARSMRAALREVPDDELNYGDPRGSHRLRSALATYLGRVRGIDTDADRIVVVNGVAQALVVCTLMFGRQRPPKIAVEDPGSAGLIDQLSWWGVRTLPVPVDQQGVRVDDLPSDSQIDAVAVTPAHQYPTGVTLTGERRHELVEWAGRHDSIVIEDDYDAEFRYDREPLTSLQALAPDRVVAVGSVSKILSPALRLGWLVLPDRWVEPAATSKAYIDLGTSLLPQVALANFLESGAMDRHVRSCRTHYRRRRDALVGTLVERCPDVTIDGIAAGLHVLIRLDHHRQPERVVEAARTAGLTAQPLEKYRHHPGPPGVVVGYAGRRPDAVEAAAAAIADAINAG